MQPNGSRDQFNFANELMCVILKGNIFHNSHGLGDLNVWLLNFTISINHINFFKYIITGIIVTTHNMVWVYIVYTEFFMEGRGHKNIFTNEKYLYKK